MLAASIDLNQTFAITTSLLQNRETPTATLLCAIRFLANVHRYDEMRKSFFCLCNFKHLMEGLRLQMTSSSKPLRTSLASLLLNLTLSIAPAKARPSTSYSLNASQSMEYYTMLMPLIVDFIRAENEVEDILNRCFVALGT
jgi:hypothetical protein